MQKKILLLGVIALFLVGCATSTRYINYTDQRFPAKDKFYSVDVFSQAQPMVGNSPYYVIGKVSIEGFASNGVSPETLTKQAKTIARKRGADAIINANTAYYRYYYGDALLRFTGDLIVYSPVAAKS